MKRLSVWQRLRLIRTAKIRLRRKQTKRQRARELRDAVHDQTAEAGSDWHAVTVYRRGKVRQSIARGRRPMPENFCLVENYDAVAGFLAQLRHRLNINGQRLEHERREGGWRQNRRRRGATIESYIDFTTLKRITPAAALVLASEYDRAISLFKVSEWLRAIDIEKWDPEVYATLDEVGFLSLLGVEIRPAMVALRNGVYTVPFISGSRVETGSIDGLIRAMADLADTSGGHNSETLLNRSRVYDGLGEAIQNVHDHAYPFGAFGTERIIKKWWMTGSVEPSKKKFTIVIYDHGITIPASLPRWTRFADFRRAFAKARGLEFEPSAPEFDGEAIAQAVQLGRSSTGKSWHGKGLPLIRDIVENCSAGTVRIMSRCGEYVYSPGEQPKHQSRDKLPMSGTLIEWELLL